MRARSTEAVRSLTRPDPSLLDEARAAAARGEEAHGRFLARLAALREIEQAAPFRPLPWTGRLRVAAFNAERLKDRPAARRLMRQAGAAVTLLSEVDLGMARSGNTHNLRDLTAGTGEGYLYGVEFVELDLGSRDEIGRCAGRRNALGFHGNAIVSAHALERPHLIPLEENGLWFRGMGGVQRRIGGRMALAARLAGAPKPLWVVSTHLESKTDPADRRAQIRALLAGLEAFAPGEACVIGGDFNTKALPRGEDERHLLLQEPERFEPLFADLREAGFAWACANLALPTQTPGPTNKHEPPFGKLDWLVVRGLEAANPQVIAAVDEAGRAISDHEMIAVDIAL
ncbi:endonuclease/exonuclease/phosphatase family protein [Microvirga arsenatis]|uniref:Endonuclease/exonuclease/phosphatase family protein n=1 Tax=Microvirga arsenatis TaxID=2692265 RepID=A0ABW9Z5X2_9HYPH|nr:endonuclease/exonuclease/phosphatase family protein [Microvirga arsenatis]NBJ11493.1 endonuclease/exonuclease/phosphatase family protein [Microvirga arsenatis]NBJ26331.1 endonuclease/exonuclease/phosphatase family protein [Microvirga arsenatis]